MGLFEDFQTKQKTAHAEKMDSEKDGLPITAFQAQIIQTIKQNRVTIISADTGAGKSTQVPQYLLKAKLGRVACTQPRRIACMSLAKRVSQEIGTSNLVAYQVRFDRNITSQTRVVFMTEGILLRLLAGDPWLRSYDVVVVDEVHERHVMCDFLLGVLKRLLVERDGDLKLVLMSATVNCGLFQGYFKGAPLVQVPGKMFDVEVDYRPWSKELDQNLVDERMHEERELAVFKQSIPAQALPLDPKPYLNIMKEIDEQVSQQERGDLLIFVSGINEITALYDSIKPYAEQTRRWIALKLHSTCSVVDQDRVFDLAPDGVRKCILSTNIAETSVTIDGVRFIVDSGRVKEMTFDYSANLSRLSEYWISQASAKQRMGRAGRTGPGKCFRLYDEKEHGNFNRFSVPEIQRGPLDQVVLQIKALDLGNPRKFDLIEPPPPENLEHSIETLQNVGALDAAEKLTLLGHTLSQLPVDVILGKMLILGSCFDLLEPILVISAAFSVQSPFTRLGLESKHDVVKNRQKLDSPYGDPFTLFNLYRAWIGVKADRRGEASRKWCQRHGVEEQRLYEMSKLVEQFRNVLQNSVNNLGTKEKSKSAPTSSNSSSNPNYNTWQQRRHEKFTVHKKRKVLAMDEAGDDPQAEYSNEIQDSKDEGSDNDQDNNQPDDNALEFSVHQDADKMWERLRGFDLSTLHAVKFNMLKIIVASGLYPNLAIPDDANSFRQPVDQVFHTKVKRFMLLHPTSIFYANPDLVAPHGHRPKSHKNQRATTSTFLNAALDGEVDLINVGQLHGNLDTSQLQPSKGAAAGAVANPLLSRDPDASAEFLCYLQLLETNKPYIVNILRVPALQTCLLFAKSIDMNESCTMLVMDHWTMVEFKDQNRNASLDISSKKQILISNLVQKLLRVTVQVRTAWMLLMGRKLLGGQDAKKMALRFQGGIDGVHHQPETPTADESSVASILPETLRNIRNDFYALNSNQSQFELLADRKVTMEQDRASFLSCMGEFLQIDALLKQNGVQTIVDTLHGDHLALLFPGLGSGVKTGVEVCSYIRYGSVQYPSALTSSTQAPVIGTSRSSKRVWTCSKCRCSMLVSVDEGDAHLASCSGPVDSSSTAKLSFLNPSTTASSDSPSQPPAKGKPMKCETCQETLWLTPIEFLRHKKACAS